LSGTFSFIRRNSKLFLKLKNQRMEKFMLIFHGRIRPDSSPEQLQNNMNQWIQWVEKLHQEGRYVSGEALLRGGKLVTGKTSVTDGPYTEGKEVVGGFFVINAANYDEAIKECENYPDFSYGGQIQVRQVMNIDM
jgi:hypothetical protein